MDRALKERIIGAAVLVALAVLVVPVFLDGPSDEVDIVTEAVSLPGQNDPARKTQTIVLDRDRTEPVPASAPAAGNSDKAVRETDDAAAEAKPVAAAAKSRTASAATVVPPESPTGMWAVQIGSFSDQANADRLAADLRKAGYAAFLSQLQTESGSLHRVRIGPQKSRDGAEAIAAKLKSAGHDGQVVTHP